MAFQTGKKTQASLPISKHPLFPVMVALWFAAAFGLGTVAIGLTLLEKVVIALHLDVIVPAAAPPLGFSARILLALMMFALGAAIGFVLARWIARPASEARTARFTRSDEDDQPSLSSASPATSTPIPGRRRALAMEEDFTADYRDPAPLPGHEAIHTTNLDPQIHDLAALGPMAEMGEQAKPEAEPVIDEQAFDPWQRHLPQAEAEPEAAPDAAEDPHDHRAFDAPDATAAHDPAHDASADDSDHTPEHAAEAAAPPPPFAPPLPSPAELVTPAAANPAPAAPLGLISQDAAEHLTSAPLASLGVVQLAERLALAIARRRAPEAAAQVVVPVAAPVAAIAAPEPDAAKVEVEITPAQAESVVQPEPVEPPAPPPFAAPAPFAAPVAMPQAMRPLSFDEADDDDDDAPLASILPPRRFGMPPAAVPATSPAEVEVEAGETPDQAEPVAPATVASEHDENFASLLGMKPTLRQSFVRVDEPDAEDAAIEPVVVFPGQAPRFAAIARPFDSAAPITEQPPASAATPLDAGRRFDAPGAGVTSSVPANPAVDPEETERALKAALATLQRMSGAA